MWVDLIIHIIELYGIGDIYLYNFGVVDYSLIDRLVSCISRLYLNYDNLCTIFKLSLIF